MKLRNKKTGEIVDYYGTSVAGYGKLYNSLSELNEDWEDYEEPKEYWFIRDHTSCVGYAPADNNATAKYRKESIGNYFDTREEAEKAVEKLKAWKRLKDNGFKFEGIEKRGHHINFYQGRSYETDKQCQQSMKDLELLFGGEE